MGSKPISFDEKWAEIYKVMTKLKRIIEGLPDLTISSEEYMTVHTCVYDICTGSPPCDANIERLYNKYREVYEEYIASTVLPSLREKHGEFLLRELVKRRENHKVMTRWLSRLFHYLNPAYVKQRIVPTPHEVGIICFRDTVYAELNAKAIDIMIGLIERDREGEQVDRGLLKKVVDVFVEMDVRGELKCYQQDFEAAMLEDSGKHYSRLASGWIVEDSCPDYMVKVEKCLKSERETVARYVHSSTEHKLVARIKHELLVVYKAQLLENEDSGFRALIWNDKVEDLSRMFNLYIEIPEGLEFGANIFEQHITSEGTMLVQEVEDASSSLVANIIRLHDRYMEYVDGCFKNHAFFHRALREAFEELCNKDVAGTSFAELLSMFCDDMLKKGGACEKLSDETIEENLENALKLLVYVSDRDLFTKFYKKTLSRRLLFGKSASQENEDLILTKLKQQFGAQFTSRMEAMVTDIKLSKESQKNFKKYLQDNHPDVNTLGIDLNVTVLTTTSWPNFKSTDLTLPHEMLKCIEAFKGFYNMKTQNRKLTWVNSQGTCNIHGRFEAKTIELVVTTCQAALLLLFNSAERLSYSEISIQLTINGQELVALLHSLSCSKYKILKKTPNTAVVSPNDTFEFNSKFTDKMRRIRIAPPSLVAVAEERKKVVEEVDKDRRYAIDAAIVRIMKSRKVLKYQELLIECVKHLSPMFKPDIRAIKKRTEDLITRDYLERDKDDPNTFKYIA